MAERKRTFRGRVRAVRRAWVRKGVSARRKSLHPEWYKGMFI